MFQGSLSELSVKPGKQLSVLISQFEDAADYEFAEMVAYSYGLTFKTFLASNFILHILLSVGMQSMWGLLNALQMIVLTVLFDLGMPANNEIVSISILKLCFFDLFQTENTYN